MKSEFESILKKVKQFLVLEGNFARIVDLYLASALSIETERPVWLMVIAPPSSGKTELIRLVDKVDNYHALFNITARTLFSSHPMANGGYMIREVGEKGLIVFPDFTTILSQNSKVRNEIFNQLRIIFDGRAGQGSGIDVGSIRQWNGKVAILATVTETIEKIKETQNDLGERFLYYRFSPPEIDYSRLEQLAKSEASKESIGNTVKEYLDECKNHLSETIISAENENKLYMIAKFISIGRATVERDGYGRSISDIHIPEQPFRVFGLLKSLFKCLYTINGDEVRSFEIIQLIAKSSIPKFRMMAIATTYFQDYGVPIEGYISALGVSESKVRRILEDLTKQKILHIQTNTKDKQFFYLTEDFRLKVNEILKK